MMVAVAVLAGAVSSPVAAASTESIYTRVLNGYQARGAIDPCEFSAAQLEAAQNALGTAGGQYFGDFVQAIQTALASRATGVCAAHPHPTGAAHSAPLPPGSAGPPLPVPLQSTGGGVPLPLTVMAALAAALALLAGGLAAVRRTGFDPGWAVAGRHTFSEAAHRVAGSWEDFMDWLRSGSDVRD